MAQSTLVIAESGSGKSTSGRTLDSKETFWINIANKPLPFKGWRKDYTLISKDNPKGNMTNASSAAGIIKAIQHVNDKMPHITNLVVDDWQYMSAFEYFDKANEKGYDKFTSIASNLAQVAKMPKDLRDDLYIVLFGKVIKDDDGILKYGFETQNDGNNTCKSPMGMFEESFIENDLQHVKDCIIKYEQ